MIIRRPIAALPDKHNRYRTVLQFETGDKIAFYLRGAIGWPEGPNEGFAMLAGQSIETGRIVIFEQFPFWTVSPWLDERGGVRLREEGGYHTGLIQFVLDMEAKYKCCSFFHGGQHADVVRRHTLDLYRNPLLPKRIELIEVPYVKEIGDDLIIEKLNTDAFTGEVDSLLARAVEQWVKLRSAGTGDNNRIHALRALLAGYESNQYIKPRDNQ